MLFNILFIFTMLVVGHASSGGNKPILVLQQDLVSLFTRKGEVCRAQVDVKPTIMHRFSPWKLEESEVNGKFLLCLAKELEFYEKDGKVNVDKFIDLFYDSLKSQDVEEYRKLLTRCNELTGLNVYYTVYNIANCFYTNAPAEIVLRAIVY